MLDALGWHYGAHYGQEKHCQETESWIQALSLEPSNGLYGWCMSAQAPAMHLRACELCGMCMEPMDHMHPLGRAGGTAVGSQQVKVTPKTAFTSK